VHLHCCGVEHPHLPTYRETVGSMAVRTHNGRALGSAGHGPRAPGTVSRRARIEPSSRRSEKNCRRERFRTSDPYLPCQFRAIADLRAKSGPKRPQKARWSPFGTGKPCPNRRDQKKGGATQWVKVPTQKEPEAVKLRRRFAGESRGRCLLTNPALGRGATLRAAGIER
jgi:hypothetical protein